MTCQPNLFSQEFNIESMFDHSDVSDVPILDAMSAWSMRSSIEYWVNVQPLRCFRCSNIGCYVSLIHVVQHWILSEPSATSMFPVFQYWMPCQPDPCGQVLNIESIFGRSDVTSVSILNDIPSNIETMETWEWPKIDSIFNAWSQCSGWHVIQYWNTTNIRVERLTQ